MFSFLEMASGSDCGDSGEILQLLLTKRPKTIDWNKCIVCQIDAADILRRASASGLEVFWAAARHREDDVYQRLLPSMNFVGLKRNVLACQLL